MTQSKSQGDRRDRIARDLDNRILHWIGGTDRSAPGFERLALDLFAYQYAHNEPYRRYCNRSGRGPESVATWRDVPPVPTSVFAATRLACFAADRTVLTFVSSGTTSAGARPSTHELDTGELYDASLLAHFRSRVLPDAATMRLVALAPPFEEMPQSSLSYMLSKISSVFGTPADGFFVRNDRLDFDAASAALQDGVDPVVVFGTAFAFVHFFDACRRRKVRFSLPAGSRVVETGGFKGKSREVPREALYRDFIELLGLPRTLCLSEYGMCELGSQWYDANLDDYFTGRSPRNDVKVGPHWAKALIVDPLTAVPVRSGDVGLIQLFDLSNRGSVAAVLTADLGREHDGGFEHLGRFAGAPPKGCSIAADAMLRSGND
jgi:hypothetical protein